MFLFKHGLVSFVADCGRALLAHLTVLPLSAICLGKTFEGFDDSESEKDKVFFLLMQIVLLFLQIADGEENNCDVSHVGAFVL